VPKRLAGIRPQLWILNSWDPSKTGNLKARNNDKPPRKRPPGYRTPAADPATRPGPKAPRTRQPHEKPAPYGHKNLSSTSPLWQPTAPQVRVACLVLQPTAGLCPNFSTSLASRHGTPPFTASSEPSFFSRPLQASVPPSTLPRPRRAPPTPHGRTTIWSIRESTSVNRENMPRHPALAARSTSDPPNRQRLLASRPRSHCCASQRGGEE